jgi:vacuolar protein sorting-associated protein 13A/C
MCFIPNICVQCEPTFECGIAHRFGAATKITKSLGRGASLLTFDDEYIEERQRLQRKRGFMIGVYSLGAGFVQGITGVMMAPIRGAQRDGIVGFVKGVGKGALGVVVKPVIGVLDFASQSFGTIERYADEHGELMHQCVRYPRFFGDDRVLRRFDMHQAWLWYVSCHGVFMIDRKM